MGGCGGKTNENEVTVPQNHRQQMINQVQNYDFSNLLKQFSQFMRLDHPLNVNHKYTAFFKIIPEQFVGVGIKKTNQYESRLSKVEWLKKRLEFWDTRIEGRLECWQAIMMALDSSEQDAIVILHAADLKLVNKSIQILYDVQGHKYDVPVFCINDPQQFPEKNSTENGLNQQFNTDEEIKITIRSSKFQPQDIQMNVSKAQIVENLKTQIQQTQKDQVIVKIRLFFNGRELADHHQLGNYNVGNTSVIQAFCFEQMQQ